MPLIQNSSYRTPWWLRNGHLATIIPSVLRKIDGVDYSRERINTPDQDFIDLDWLQGDNTQLVVLMHGLEGDSERPYMKGMAKYFHKQSWDVVAYNCRGCSGEVNKQPRLYHHGDTDDVDAVMQHIAGQYNYKEVVLIGFSMGGSLILNYLGNTRHKIFDAIKSAIVFSVPCDLKASAMELSKSGNGFYRKRFLKKLAHKIQQKAVQFPTLINADGVAEIDSFQEFETTYTAPLHGFDSADAFYKYATANNYLENIQVPVLIVNAANDPLFSEACFPIAQARKLPNVYLEIPTHGGHVGFSKSNLAENWMEERALQFINDLQ
jgi:predicted alpha/beta-fold hydrolase